MDESQLVFITPLRFLIVGIFGSLYVFGGRRLKRLRRFAGGLVLAGGTSFLAVACGTFNPLILIASMLYVPALTVGYGGDDTAVVFSRRLAYGSILGAIGLLIGFSAGVWELGAMQAALCVVSNVLLGVLNPAKEATREEGVIALLSTGIVPFMV